MHPRFLISLLLTPFIFSLTIQKPKGFPLDSIQTSSFPNITRPNLKGNWYVETTLDETDPEFLTIEADFISEYITPDPTSTEKIPDHPMLFVVVVTDYLTTTRAPIFNRLSQIFASAHLNNYQLILRHYYRNGEPTDFSIIISDVRQFTTFIKSQMITYPNVLYVWQAGWIGITFGEWCCSPTTPDNDLGQDLEIAMKKYFIIETMLGVGNNLTISLRSPRDIANYFHGIGMFII